MTTSAIEEDDVVFVARDLAVRPSCAAPGMWLASWGEGSERETLEITPQVAKILVALPQSTQASEVEELLGSLMPAPQAATLVSYLLANGMLTRARAALPLGERRLQAMNWADALVLHRATRGQLWRHEYPQDAQIMTWTNYDIPVPVTEPRPHVRYDDLPDTVQLSKPRLDRMDTGISEVFARRRTKRSFAGTVVPEWALSTLLHIAFRPVIQGVNRRYFTTLSSADGYREKAELHPISAYVLFGAAGLLSDHADAVYRYNPESHALQTIRSGSLPGYFRFSELLWGQDFADESSTAIVLSVNWPQFQWKYRSSHAYRFAHYDLGAYMQTALLSATALGMDTFITPALNDIKVTRLLGSTEHVSSPTYFLALGMDPAQNVSAAVSDE
jgi:SagB-type dehydrogenase family enzyme